MKFVQLYSEVKSLFKGPKAAELASLLAHIKYLQQPKINDLQKIDVDGETYVYMTYSRYLKISGSSYSRRTFGRYIALLIEKGLICRHNLAYYRAPTAGNCR